MDREELLEAACAKLQVLVCCFGEMLALLHHLSTMEIITASVCLDGLAWFVSTSAGHRAGEGAQCKLNPCLSSLKTDVLVL